MGLLNFFKKKSKETTSTNKSNASTISNLDDNELYGKAWLMIIGQKQKEQGLKILRELDKKGDSNATIALAMYVEDQDERKCLVKKAADAGNVEGMWEYSGYLPHSYIPDPNNKNDALWEKYCLNAAEAGSVDAMNEMGNVYHRRGHYFESMYWYAMADVNGQPDGQISMQGITKEWLNNNCPTSYRKGSPKFDKARFKCALNYLDMYAGKKLSVSSDEILSYVLSGVPIAAYFAGDIFEGIGNEKMACNIYKTMSLKYDPHAMKCYADMLFCGKGTERDVNSAFKVYSKAAELGERSAMFIIGEFTKESNKNLAAYWYGLAYSRGYKPALQGLIQLAK